MNITGSRDVKVFFIDDDKVMIDGKMYYEKSPQKQNKTNGGTMAKYRKKPVVIEAYQTDKEFEIKTLEGTMKADIGDWIITGVKGEQYPCKPDIFEATYDLVE